MRRTRVHKRAERDKRTGHTREQVAERRDLIAARYSLGDTPLKISRAMNVALHTVSADLTLLARQGRIQRGT